MDRFDKKMANVSEEAQKGRSKLAAQAAAQGKYLLAKLEIAMAKAGALEVDKIEGKSGNYVFMNAHAVGLSSKLSDFEGLAVRMAGYESTLAKMTGHLSGKKTAGEATTNVPPPE